MLKLMQRIVPSLKKRPNNPHNDNELLLLLRWQALGYCMFIKYRPCDNLHILHEILVHKNDRRRKCRVKPNSTRNWRPRLRVD